MNLKLFEKSIFKTDMKRFWIASLLYTVLLFFLVAFVYVSRGYLDTTYQIPDEYLRTAFCSNTYPAIVLGILCGGVFALMLFVYINSTSANSFYHSLPCRRTTLYFTKLISGVVLLVIPVVVNLLILIGAKASGTLIPAHYNHLFKWAYLQLAYTILIFLGVSFVAMFTGNFMYLIAISGICIFSPLIIIAFIEGVFSENLYGYVGSFEQYLEWVYLLPEKMFTPRVFIYLILAILFVVFGCILYNKRNLENNGEAVVFKGAKVFFLYLVAVLCGICSYWYFSSLLANSILWMLPFGLIGIMGANMINRKQVTLKGFLKPALIYTVAVVLLFTAFLTDITGFERRVPNPDTVAEVKVSIPMLESNFSTYDAEYSFREYYDEIKSGNTITDAEEIKKVTALHQHKIENRYGEGMAYFVNIEYKLKNGKSLKRAYTVFRDSDKSLAQDVFMFESLKARRYHNYKENLNYLYFSVSNEFIPGGDFISYMSGTIEFDEIKDALNKDIAEITYDEDTTLDPNGYGTSQMVITVGFQPDTSGYVPNKEDALYAAGDRIPKVEYRYTISDGYKRTKALLEKYGLYENITKIDQINGARIRIYGENYMETYVEDRQDVEKLYEIALNYDRKQNYDSSNLVDFVFELYNGDSISTNIPTELVEEIINKYL